MKTLTLILLTFSINSLAMQLKKSLNNEDTDLIKRAMADNLRTKKIVCTDNLDGSTFEDEGTKLIRFIQNPDAVLTVEGFPSPPGQHYIRINSTDIQRRVNEVVFFNLSYDSKDLESFGGKIFNLERRQINVGTITNPLYETREVKSLIWDQSCDIR